MKTLYKYLSVVLIVAFLIPMSLTMKAGNKDRTGQAGATELLINPWTRSSGWGSANMSRVRGLEAMWGNVAGTAFTQGTQLIFSSTQWLKGTETNIMAFGIAQHIGETGVLGIQVMSMSFGEVDIKTVANPDESQGTFKPNLMNMGISYSKAFSNSIYAGVLVKIISESIADVSAVGVALDAGIQYVTGAEEQITFGIALKNWGPKMNFSGDGLSISTLLSGQDDESTLEQRAASFEIPAQLNIGAAYDFLFPNNYRLTVAGTFVSNSFSKDQFVGGLEFSLKEYVQLRGGYTYENGMFENTLDVENTNITNGLSAGLTVQVPLSKEKGSYIGVDYSYRETQSFNGTHSVGVIFNF